MADIYFVCPHCDAIVAVQDQLLYTGTVIDCVECGGRVAETRREKEFWGDGAPEEEEGEQ